ncbi:LytTR family DNA-binding domain-containing protein [Pseudenhygromyxa sp. WMMC2535]|uniref:LytR/AlgR family response regulator transcription factor n=1 Tax=Pseudenhygromyxa sp. WMMC2535 TaxID=2712867 RepID=UPI0020D03AA2|nr:LytTR family DNA-binding domain-containing protein [Pseudenhygromyxa sp. WMMC2535]
MIVDDEAPARRRLRRMLERIEDVDVVAEAGDGVEALERLASHAPEALFLDIQMPGRDGLSLARVASLPPLVFVTAYDEHALAAFDVGAVDYLLKPVSRERLAAAVERLRERVAGPADAGLDDLRATLARLAGPSVAPAVASPAVASSGLAPRVGAREGASVRLFEVAEIGRFWSADKYTLFRHGGREHVLDESLSELELRLSAHGFARVHRSELVNLAWVSALHQEPGGVELELRDGQRAPVSRRMVAKVKRDLGL